MRFSGRSATTPMARELGEGSVDLARSKCDHPPRAMSTAPSHVLQRLANLPEPQRKLGPYRLLRPLGKGGFAEVWLAKETFGGIEIRDAAVKLFPLQNDGPLSSGSRPSTGGSQRIIEEARALCQVEHPNVVRFYQLAVDEHASLIGLAMEYVAGRSLEDRFIENAVLDIDEVLAAGVAVASALSAVHRAGFVHRDVKPANIVEYQGVYKLIDFGIAASHDATKPRPEATTGGVVIADDLPIEIGKTRLSELADRLTLQSSARASITGTAGYADPICLRDDRPASAESDIYGLGATLYRCLSGKLTAASTNTTSAFDRRVLDGRAPAPPIESYVELPSGLADLINRMLSLDAGQRPSADQVAHELEQIRAERRGRKRTLPDEATGPFRGLDRFEQQHRDVYFGRAPEIASSVEILRTKGLLTLMGPSGSGKSSLARAGVLAAVSEGALPGWPRSWDVVIASPGLDPRGAVGEALARVLPGALSMSPDTLVDALVQRAGNEGRGTILLLDQAEELATQASGSGQAWMLQLVERVATQKRPGLRMVVAVRQDYLDDVMGLSKSLGMALGQSLLLIRPLTETEWGSVLDQALSVYGYSFEDEALRGKVLEEMRASTTSMPLNQFALTELWQHRDAEKKLLTHAGYEAIGRISGALERHADRTLDGLVGRDVKREEVARRVLLSMTTPKGDARAPAKLEETQGRIGSPQVLSILEGLEEARLVVREPSGWTLAHDVLLLQWKRLRGWIQDARRDRELAEEIRGDAERWEEHRDAAMLWKKRRLAAALDLMKRDPAALQDLARSFVRESRAVERQGRLMAAGAAVLVVLIAMGGTAKYVVDTKQEQRRAEDALSKLTAETKAKIAAWESLNTKQKELDDRDTKLNAATQRLDDIKRNYIANIRSMEAETANCKRAREVMEAALAELGSDLPKEPRKKLVVVPSPPVVPPPQLPDDPGSYDMQ